MYEIKKSFNICCAHRLSSKTIDEETNQHCFGKCTNFHGHNYKIILTLRQSWIDRTTNMIRNFDEVKKIFKLEIDDVYDHKLLNDCPGFSDILPTAEAMAFIFYNRLKDYIKELYSVEIFETDTASAIYYGDNYEYT